MKMLSRIQQYSPITLAVLLLALTSLSSAQGQSPLGSELANALHWRLVGPYRAG